MQPKPRQKKKSRSKKLFFLWFFPPIGIIVLAVGIYRLLTQGIAEQSVMLIIFGLMWAIVPAVLFSALRAQDKKQAIEQTRKRSDPTPWLRRADWAKGEIAGSENRMLYGYFLGAGIALIFGAIFFSRLSGFGGESGNTFEIVLACFFGIVPLTMIVLGVRAVARQKNFGQSILKMAAVPAEVGGKLEGTIEISGKVRPVNGFKLHLRCLHVVVTGSGKNQRTRTDVLWEEKTTAYDRADNPSQPTVPVAFQIPAECEESDDADSNDRIVWQLEARADVPGVDYLSRFEVPVFRMNAADATPSTRI